MKQDRTIAYTLGALALWVIFVSAYSSANNMGDKTPVLIAMMMALFVIPVSLGMIIWGIYLTLRSDPDAGSRKVFLGVVLWPMGFLLYLAIAVFICG